MVEGRGGEALEQSLRKGAFWSGEDTSALGSPTALWLTVSGVQAWLRTLLYPPVFFSK